MSAPLGLVNCARDTEWIGCVDFGTAFSKFAMVRAVDREELTKSDVQALPVAAGPDYTAANEWLLPSVLFVTEDAILFGEEAQRMAIRSHGSAREAFSSPKQYLSTDDFDLYDAYLRKEIDPTGKFTPRKLLRLFIAHLLERAGAHAAAGELPWPVPLRLARPAWDKKRGKEGEKRLQDLVIAGFGLVDELGGLLSKAGGVPHAAALKALEKAEKPAQPSGGMFLTRNGSASVLEATAVAANSTRKRGRRIVVVADIGGGTSDFGSFMTPIRGTKTIAEVKGSSHILKQAGDYLDMQLLRLILDRAGYVSSHPAAQGVSRRLLAQARSNKESLFVNGVLREEVGEELVEISLQEFLEDRKVQEFVQRLRERFYKTLVIAKTCAEKNRSRNGLTPPIEIMLTGGGHALPMVQELVKDPCLPGLYTPAAPEFLEDDVPFPFDGVRRQLAVAVGGAMRDLPSTRSIEVALDCAPAEAGGA
jgi:molecular chaperone DnaK (HSP70)